MTVFRKFTAQMYLKLGTMLFSKDVYDIKHAFIDHVVLDFYQFRMDCHFWIYNLFRSYHHFSSYY